MFGKDLDDILRRRIGKSLTFFTLVAESKCHKKAKDLLKPLFQTMLLAIRFRKFHY
jgi:hypothetical protein